MLRRASAGISILLLASVARAAGFNPPPNPGDAFPVGSLGELLRRIINTVLLLVGVLAVGFIVYGGFKYITARGDETTIEEAKRTIAGGIIGIVVIGLAFVIVEFAFCAVGGGGAGLFCPA